MQIEQINTLVAEAIAPIAGKGVDKSFYDDYGLKCGIAAVQAVLLEKANDEKRNGWKIERYDGQYLYISFEGKPGVIQVKADDEGFVVDAYVAGMEEEPVGTMAVEYSDLEQDVEDNTASAGNIPVTAKSCFVGDCV